MALGIPRSPSRSLAVPALGRTEKVVRRTGDALVPCGMGSSPSSAECAAREAAACSINVKMVRRSAPRGRGLRTDEVQPGVIPRMGCLALRGGCCVRASPGRLVMDQIRGRDEQDMYCRGNRCAVDENERAAAVIDVGGQKRQARCDGA